MLEYDKKYYKIKIYYIIIKTHFQIYKKIWEFSKILFSPFQQSLTLWNLYNQNKFTIDKNI